MRGAQLENKINCENQSPHLGRRERQRERAFLRVCITAMTQVAKLPSVFICSVWQGETYRTSMMQKVSFGPTFWWMFTSQLWVNFWGTWWNISLLQLLLGFVHLIPHFVMNVHQVWLWTMSSFFWQTSGNISYLNYCWFEVWTCHNRYHQAGSLFELHELVANDPWPQYGWYGDEHKIWLVMQINLE
jgi:hypothetical protein